MGTVYYPVIGAVWVIACMLIAKVVTGRGMTLRRQISIGVSLIFLLYAAGAAILVAAIFLK